MVTYPIAHHQGYQSGYGKGIDGGLRLGCFGQSLGLLEALRRVRAGDLPRATRFLETECFASANTYYRNPTPEPGEPEQTPNADMARALAKGLWEYRAAYRTNSADWDDQERNLDTRLARVKSDDPEAWGSLRITPEPAGRNRGN